MSRPKLPLARGWQECPTCGRRWARFYQRPCFHTEEERRFASILRRLGFEK